MKLRTVQFIRVKMFSGCPFNSRPGVHPGNEKHRINLWENFGRSAPNFSALLKFFQTVYNVTRSPCYIFNSSRTFLIQKKIKTFYQKKRNHNINFWRKSNDFSKATYCMDILSCTGDADLRCSRFVTNFIFELHAFQLLFNSKVKFRN